MDPWPSPAFQPSHLCRHSAPRAPSFGFSSTEPSEEPEVHACAFVPLRPCTCSCLPTCLSFRSQTLEAFLQAPRYHPRHTLVPSLMFLLYSGHISVAIAK